MAVFAPSPESIRLNGGDGNDPENWKASREKGGTLGRKNAL